MLNDEGNVTEKFTPLEIRTESDSTIGPLKGVPLYVSVRVQLTRRLRSRVSNGSYRNYLNVSFIILSFAARSSIKIPVLFGVRKTSAGNRRSKLTRRFGDTAI